MSTAHLEIRITDFNETYFALTVTDAPRLSPELARKSFPISRQALADLARPDFSWAVNSRDDALRAPGSPAGQSIEAFGETLFDALIWHHRDPDLIACWTDFAGLTDPARSLRLCLANQVPDLPWEALRDPYKLNGALARHLSVVRRFPTAPAIAPVDLGGDPLRMLVVFADPDGDLTTASAIQKERTAILEAPQTTLARRDLQIDFIDPGKGPTLDQLREAIAARTYHILHYFGHGHSVGQGQLDFEGARRGEATCVRWEDLQDALQPTLSSLRLIVLNACELAQPGKNQVKYTPFTNLAACFLNAGATMVVAMQYPIRTDTATTFTRKFYEHLGAQRFASAAGIETAVIEGRKAILSKQNAVEWITPVLFTKMQDDTIFRMPNARHSACTAVSDLYARGCWIEAAEKVQEVLQADPGSEEALHWREQLLDKAAGMIAQRDPAGGKIVEALDEPVHAP